MDGGSDLLYNCTYQLLEFREFQNASFYFVQNLTSISELLQLLFDERDERLSVGVKKSAKEFIESCLLPPRPSDLAWWQKLVWTIVFSVMLLVATGGNTIVMWIVLAHRRMRTVTNYFLVNLSLSDLLMSLLNCIFNFIYMLNSNWPFGTVYCTLSNFVSSVTVAAGVFTLMAISFDRYMAIRRPLQHRMSHRKARLALAIIWIASALLGVPPLLYSTTMTKRYGDGQTRIICYMLWPDGAYPTSMTEYVYNLVFLAVTYIVPMTVMAVCYTLMGIELWGSRSIGEFTQRQMDSIKSKRKVVRMFIIVVTIFAFCWLPYHGYFIYAYHNNSIAGSAYVQHVYLSFYWLAMSNAMVNPIIYYWMNARFRVYFQRVICCCCLRSDYKNDYPIIPKVTRACNRSEYGRGRLRDSNSELGATSSQQSRLSSCRSANQIKYSSMKWQRRVDHSEMAHMTCIRNVDQNCDPSIT